MNKEGTASINQMETNTAPGIKSADIACAVGKTACTTAHKDGADSVSSSSFTVRELDEPGVCEHVRVLLKPEAVLEWVFEPGLEQWVLYN